MAIYALGDLHGRLDIYKEIKAFLNPEDKVYFLGDAVDRGPDSWELCKAILDDPQFEYLMGNHEDMLLAAIRSAKKYQDTGSQFDNPEFMQCYKNEGAQTVYDCWNDPNRDYYIHLLHNLPYQKLYANECGILVWLSHAGLTPNEYSMPGNFDLLWDREHFYDDWNEETFGPCVVVHGHTPLPYMWNYLCIPQEDRETGAFWYCNAHKICIDTGAYATNIAILLDLDTFDEHLFEVPQIIE